jgi:hypothetical protein
MRLIRPAGPPGHRWALALALAMLVVGATAILLMAALSEGRLSAVAALGVAAALGLGIGVAWLTRALTDGHRRPQGKDLVRLLAPVFDDSYVLILAPWLPDVPPDLAGLLIGPAGVRALISRRWRGRYRVRGRAWDHDTGSSEGWIPCRTNPSFDADAVADAVARWARIAADEPALPIAPAIAFPLPSSVVVLEEPEGEIVTADNAPWWGQRIGRVQRMDPPRVARFVQAVIDAADAGSDRVSAAEPNRA